jgi:hypothetical protein
MSSPPVRLVWDFRLNRTRVKIGPIHHTGDKLEFDCNTHRYKTEGGYSKKQKRAFHRLMSGLTVGKSRREHLRFMTLTSSPESIGRNLNADFRALKMRIYRKFHFKMKYWKIRTNEGNGVLHIVYRGKFIPQRWLSDAWLDIHQSPIVDIRKLYETRKGLTGIVFYLVGGYLSKQSFERMSWGYSWVFPGFVATWKRLITNYGFRRSLELWNKLLSSQFIVTHQVRMTKFLPEIESSNEKHRLWGGFFAFSIGKEETHQKKLGLYIN